MKPTLAIALLLTLEACRSQPASNDRKSTTNMPPAPPPANSVPVPPRVLHEGVKSAPERLVVVLHGVGANADDLLPVARALAPSLPRAEILLPDGLHPFDGGGSGRQWFSLRGVTDANRAARVRDAASDVARWIDHELEARKLGWDRTILVGFSQGSMLSMWLALHRAPSAVVAFSGRFADDDPSARATAPILLVHGTNDAMIPVAEANVAATALAARGANVTLRIHPGLGHGIDPLGIGEARTFLDTVLK